MRAVTAPPVAQWLQWGSWGLSSLLCGADSSQWAWLRRGKGLRSLPVLIPQWFWSFSKRFV